MAFVAFLSLRSHFVQNETSLFYSVSFVPFRLKLGQLRYKDRSAPNLLQYTNVSRWDYKDGSVPDPSAPPVGKCLCLLALCEGSPTDFKRKLEFFIFQNEVRADIF